MNTDDGDVVGAVRNGWTRLEDPVASWSTFISAACRDLLEGVFGSLKQPEATACGRDLGVRPDRGEPR